jgi:hypothetical protein
MSRTLTLMLAALAVIAFGCGKGSTYKTNEGEVTVDRKGGQITYEGKSKEGSVKVSANENGVALPDDFPKDVPIYKGAVVKVAATQGKMIMVQLSVPAPMSSSTKYYQDQLKDQGWEIQSMMNMGEGSMVIAKKGDRQCSAVVSKDGSASSVQISVTPAKP